MEARHRPDHPEFSSALNTLAELLRVTGRFAEADAEPLFRRALAISESLGSDHPNVAISLNNLADLLYATNRPAEAEPMWRRALKIFEGSSGDDHPNLAINDPAARAYLQATNGLAHLLRATNRLAEAEPLYRRALAIDEKSYGPEHPERRR